MKLEDLQGIHWGETIWVLGSGPSLNFVTPAFFADKVVVSTNFSARTLGFEPQYVFSHYHDDTHDLAGDSGIVVTLANNWETGEPYPDPDNPRVVLIAQDTHVPPGSTWNPLTSHPPRKDSLVYGSSSFHGAMHLAAHLGANFIVLVGADCGTIDGEHRLSGYMANDNPWAMHALYNKHHKLMKDYLREAYGVEVYSLNPFINFNLEGHTFNGPS